MFNEELENIIGVLEDVKTISYGSCTIDGEVFEDYADDTGAERWWMINCVSRFSWLNDKSFAVDIEVPVEIEDDGVLFVDIEGMEINGHLISDEHKKNIEGLFEERLHKLQPNTAEYVEEVMWTLVKFIERGLTDA
jgi:hypothetical protein